MEQEIRAVHSQQEGYERQVLLHAISTVNNDQQLD